MQTASSQAGNSRLKRFGAAALAGACLAWAAGFSAALADDTVSIKRLPVSVDERYFDPDHLPDPPPPVPPGLKAVTKWDYPCRASINADWADNGYPVADGVRAGIIVRSYDINLSMPIIVWLPRGASRKLRQHEIGHTEIDKHIYEHGNELARTCARPLVGQQFYGQGRTLDEARQDAMQKAIMAFCDRYHEGTTNMARSLGAYYDRLTDHGRNDYDTEQAVKETLQYGGV